MEQVILANLKLLLPKSVQDLKNMRSIYIVPKSIICFKRDKNQHKISVLTFQQDGPWHRDTYNLNGESNPDGTYDDSLVMKLKPFYYTVLIPLDDITEENGRTEFITGSHR